MRACYTVQAEFTEFFYEGFLCALRVLCGEQ